MTERVVHDDEVLFNINQVAKILDVVPATIRNWEKSGLFEAKRKNNNYRVYSLDDIEFLKTIRFYSMDQKMSSIAIKNILKTNLPKAPIVASIEQARTPAEYSKKFLSGKWKASRENLGLTLEEVSSQVGISVSYLSKLENGQGNISFNLLSTLANFYGGSILDFFEIEDNDRNLVKKGTGEKTEIGIPGVKVESLLAQKNHMLHPMMFFVEPGCGSPETHRHNGEEFIYLIIGTLQVILNENEIYQMEPGDSMYFKSKSYHSWSNNGQDVCRMIWVHSPIMI